MGFLHLPSDVILFSIAYLQYTDDLNALCRTSRALHGLLNLALYKRSIDTGNGGYTLEWAAMHGQVSTARHILQAGTPPSACGSEQWQPFALAAIHGHLEIVRLLLEYGVNPCSISNDWFNWNWKKPIFNPLQGAEEAKFRKEFQKEGHPLSLAASKGQVSIIKLLLQHNVPPDLRSNGDEKHTALHLAAREGHIEIVRILVEATSSIDAQTNSGFTPLTLAASKGHLEIVQLLLKQGADPNITSSNGYTLLSIASTSGNINIVRCLFNYGATLTPSYQDVKRPIYQISLAAERGFDEIVDLFLSKHNFIKSSTKPYQRTILFCIAAMTGHTTLLIDLIRKHNYDPNLALDPRFPILYTYPCSVFPAKRPEAAISWAATYNQVSAIKVLIANGASITPPNDDSPLICAIERGHKDVVETLIIHGVDPNKPPGKALHRAISNPPIFSLLLSHNADPTNTPRHINIPERIIRSGQVDTLRILLDHPKGLEVVAKDPCPSSEPTNCEQSATKLFKLALCGGEGIFRILLSRGLLTIPKELSGVSANSTLEDAMRFGSSFVRLLLEIGFKVTVDEMAVIWHCANSNDADNLLGIFLQNGYKLDVQDTKIRPVGNRVTFKLAKLDWRLATSTRTALFYAAELGSARSMQPLLKKGADVQVVCCEETPLSVAAKGKHLDAVRLILRAFDERGLGLDQVENMLNQAEKYALEVGQADIMKALDQFRCRRLYPVPPSQ